MQKLFTINCEQAGQYIGVGYFTNVLCTKSHDRICLTGNFTKDFQPVHPAWQRGTVITWNPNQESQYPFELKYLDKIEWSKKFKTSATWFTVKYSWFQSF